MTDRTKARLNVAAGVAVLLWIARPLPAIWAHKLGHEGLAVWWLTLISPTLEGHGLTMTSPLVWMFLEVPAGLVIGFGLISKGLRR